MSNRALNDEQFGNYKLSYIPPEMGTNLHAIRATTGDDDRHVGAMTWSTRPHHEVQNIHVQPEHQHQGLATAMWGMGQKARPKPQHSPDRTDAGEGWTRSVGGRIPRRI